MAIPSAAQGLIEVEGGKVFEIDSPKGAAWLESATSFRYEPTGASKPYTVRKETGKGGDYWYGYRKMSGRLHKKYIGKSSELSTAKLEEIAEALNASPQSRVTDKVTQVTETSGNLVTEKVTDKRDADRLTALELQVQGLQESLEALRDALPGKSESGNFKELPTVTDNELQIEVGNFERPSEDDIEAASVTVEEASAHAAIFGFTSEEALADCYFQVNMLQSNFDQLEDRHEAAKREIVELRSELADLKQTLVAANRDLPEAADLLNQLKADRKKSATTLADVEKILEIIEETSDE